VGGIRMHLTPTTNLNNQPDFARRVNLMQAEGINFITNCEVGVNYTATQLFDEFDAIVLCGGATMPRDLLVPGRELKGIHFAMDFLTQNTRSLLHSRLEDGRYIP